MNEGDWLNQLGLWCILCFPCFPWDVIRRVENALLGKFMSFLIFSLLVRFMWDVYMVMILLLLIPIACNMVMVDNSNVSYPHLVIIVGTWGKNIGKKGCSERISGLLPNIIDNPLSDH